MDRFLVKKPVAEVTANMRPATSPCTGAAKMADKKRPVAAPPTGATNANKKRPAATPATAAAGKKAKPTGPSMAANPAAWAKSRMIPVPAASYQDQTLLFHTLNDGCELLIGEEVWLIPPGAGAASPAGLKSLKQVGKMPGDRFAPLSGLDVAVVAVGTGFGSAPPRLALCALPTGKELPVAEIELPGVSANRSYGGSGFVRFLRTVKVPGSGGDGPAAAYLLVCTDERLFSFTVTDGPEGPTCELDATVDMAAAIGGGGRLEAAALYVCPQGRRFALCGHGGTVHMLPVDKNGVGIMPVRSVTMHEPMKRSDRDATVFDIALWRDGSNGTKMVTVGGDGCLCVARLDDGKAAVLGSSYPDEQWHASASGSGPSKQYRYAAVHRVAVNEATGVALTGSQFESVCHLWDLRSKKTSAKGKQLGSTPRVASGNPNKATIMCMAASSSGTGFFAYSNSNNDEDATLKMVVPAGAAK